MHHRSCMTNIDSFQVLHSVFTCQSLLRIFHFNTIVHILYTPMRSSFKGERNEVVLAEPLLLPARSQNMVPTIVEKNNPPDSPRQTIQLFIFHHDQPSFTS